jgi:phospholipase/carboxylesterase
LPRAGAPQQLVVMLHGYGANGDDLIGLAPMMARALPRAVFVSPHAPNHVPGYPGGRQWFALRSISQTELAMGARTAGPPLASAIQAEAKRYGLPLSQVALLGFSQGAMMALHVGLRLPDPVAAIVGFSGALPDGAALAAEITARPPVFLAHGASDDVVPVHATTEAVASLAEAGCAARFHITPGLGHAIAPDGLEIATQFLVDGFAGRHQGALSPQTLPH